MRSRALTLIAGLLVVAALLSVAAAAASPAHSHGKLTCSVCAAAHQAVDQPAQSLHPPEPQRAERVVFQLTHSHELELPYAPAAPRAPPV